MIWTIPHILFAFNNCGATGHVQTSSFWLVPESDIENNLKINFQKV